MSNLKKIIFFSIACLAVFSARAQQQAPMADAMRENGKIYVVVAVCLTILAGLFIYLVSLDRKISKIEKQKM